MKSEWSWQRGRPAIVEYAAAVLLVAAAAMATALLRKIFPATPSALFFCAVILSAWFGGWGPGMLAAILSVVVDIYLPPPSSTQGGTGSEVLRLALLLFTGIFISWISGEQKRAQAALRQARDELEQRVNERTRELTAANEGLRTEIAERKRAEALLDGQKRVLEMVAAYAPLEESLTALTRLIEAQVPGMLGSILLLDEKGGRVRHGAAPSLPPQYVAAIDGLAIGLEAGSCGTAAYLKEAVMVEDIATDPRWKDYRAMALPHGLRACWSTPIFDTKHSAVVGTFAMYYRQPALPEPEHLRLIEMATHIASIAICRHHMQAALRESEAKLKEAQRIGNIGHWERDLLADRITWSEETCRIWGVSGPEYTLTQAELQERIHPDDRQLQKQALDDAIQGRRSYNVEYRILRPNGEERFLHIRDEVASDETGKAVRLFGTVQDITERKRVERELRETKSKLEVILDASPLPITGLDPAGQITSWNKAAERVFGWTAEEALGQVCQTVPPDEREDFFSAIRKVMQGETILGLVRYRRKKSGDLLTCSVSFAPQLGERGEPTGATAIVEDVTERKQAEELLRVQEREIRAIVENSPILLSALIGSFVELTSTRLSSRSPELRKRSYWGSGSARRQRLER